MALSIVHRATGVALYFGTLLLAWWRQGPAMPGTAGRLEAVLLLGLLAVLCEIIFGRLFDAALPLAWDRLVVGGRMAAISFHSLEDRRVKQFLAGLATGCICPPDLPVCACGNEPEAELLTRRSITAEDAELELNPRSRSARLRGALKITEGRP